MVSTSGWPTSMNRVVNSPSRSICALWRTVTSVDDRRVTMAMPTASDTMKTTSMAMSQRMFCCSSHQARAASMAWTTAT